MGAWGVMPWENDTAADFLLQCQKTPIPEMVSKGLRSESKHKQIAAAWLLCQMGLTAVENARISY